MNAAKHTPMVIAAARELCRQHAVECEVNKDDCWNLYAEDFKRDAARVLEVAGAQQLLEALIAIREGGPEGGKDFAQWHRSYEPAIEKARAAIARATGAAP